MKNTTILAAMCGSFCTFAQVMPQLEHLSQEGYLLRGCMSRVASETDTRFGTAQHWRTRLEQVTGNPVITTIAGAEPLGPKHMADLMLIAPCTGNTLARLAAGITDGPVTMAAKSLLRGGRPVVIALSTNDGLGASAMNIGRLLNTRHYYFVPFRQDDPSAKPNSLQADFTQLLPTIQAALEGRQLQPLLCR